MKPKNLNSLVIALGSNLNNPYKNLIKARELLAHQFDEIKASSIYRSEPVDYLEQPEFLNQVIEYELPELTASDALQVLQKIESQFKRVKIVDKGPRVIDLDIIFYGELNLNDTELSIPHPRWAQRSFVVLPLRELPCFKTLEKCFNISKTFDHQSIVYQPKQEE